MAKTVSLVQALLVVVVTAMVAVQAGGRRQGGLRGMRRQQFHVFFFDQFNVTDVVVAQPKAGRLTTVGAPFGTLLCVNDPVTARQEADSAPLGSVTGLSVISSFDGLTSFNAFTLALDTLHPHPHTPTHLRGLHGTLNIVGLVNIFSPQPNAIAGGTGSFLFAQGSATTTVVAVNVSTPNQVYRLDIDVYLPA